MESSPRAPIRRPQPHRRPGRRAAARRRPPPVGTRTSRPTLYWDESTTSSTRRRIWAAGPRTADRRRAPPVKIADEATWVHPPLRQMDHRAAGGRPDRSTGRSVGGSPPRCSGSQGWRCSTSWRSGSGDRSGGRASRRSSSRSTACTSSRAAWRCSTSSSRRSSPPAVLFLVLDRERMDSPGQAGRWRRIDRVFGSPFRLWAGVSLGCAVATKWSGAFALLFGGWTLRDLGVHRRPARRSLRDRDRSGPSSRRSCSCRSRCYLLSYGAFFYQHGFAVHDFLTLQTARCCTTSRGTSRSSRRTPQPWTWPLLLHPVRYFQTARWLVEHRSSRSGNPALWWGFLLLLPVALVQIVAQADVAGRGRLRRLRGDVPPVVRGREDAVHLVHAAGRSVHVPGCRRRRSGRLPARSGDGVAHRCSPSITLVAALAFLPGVDGLVGRRPLGSCGSAGSPAGRSDDGQQEEAAPKAASSSSCRCRCLALGPARRVGASATVGTAHAVRSGLAVLGSTQPSCRRCRSTCRGRQAGRAHGSRLRRHAHDRSRDRSTAAAM